MVWRRPVTAQLGDPGRGRRAASDRLDPLRDLFEGRILGIQLGIGPEPVTSPLSVPKRHVGIDQAAVGNHLGRVAPDHPLEHLDRLERFPGLQAAAPERDSRCAGPGVVTEAFFQDRNRLVRSSLAAVLLGELEEQSRRAIELPPLSELGQPHA